ncbi:TRAP transporter small permease [Marinivivus vitaminiproducens]|uniref:TRAP transporter small permease n=1 Tax=Marinivivus vitaminiproducens TaxID=3035935 RepID=UPI0027A124BC|nr:TRAP transporter small permease [Geminicoccaceae bacterium SCSIO 64248]
MSAAVKAFGREAARPSPLAAILWLDKAILWGAYVVAVITTSLLFLVIALEVLVRYVTHQSLPWSNEVPSLLFPWMAMSGVVIAAQWGRHITVEFGLRLMPERVARAAMAVSQVIIAITLFYLAWAGLAILRVTASQVFPITGIAASWAYLAVVVAFVLLGITALTTCLRTFLQPGDPFALREGLDEEGAEGVS